MHSFCVLTLKAFGDFTIALTALRHTRASPDLRPPLLVAGEHLRSLAKALHVDQQVRFIGDKSWCDVPAAFDVRKHGAWAALRSLLALRSEISALGSDCTLVFDRIGWRESFISMGQYHLTLPVGSRNIYAAYTELFTSLGYKPDPIPKHSTRARLREAVLVPGSRIRRKQIPLQVSSAIHRVLEASGIRLTAIRLENEDVDLPVNLETQIIPRDFSALCASLREADLVISADSLSAHLGEHYGIPTFVLTPFPNTYWLPFTSFRDSAWANFDMLSPFNVWLDKYCEMPT
jgi:hypothetical protein